MRINDLKVETRPVSTLRPYGRNPHTHSKKQVRQIAESIRTFGWTNPILIDAAGGVIAGHGRLQSVKLLGLETVPTIRIEDMTEAQKRAYVLADNKLAENAGWDRDLLALELQGLLEMDIDFEVTATGFEMGEIDVLIAGLDGEGEADADDEAPPVKFDRPAITQPGELWMLGRHRLLCGDALKGQSYARVLDGDPAQLIFTDPPYNLLIDGHVRGLGKIKHAEFAMASGEMSEAEFTAFLKTVFGHLVAHSIDGAIHFVCIDWRHLYELLTAGRAVYTELKGLCIWNKTNGGMGSFYRSKHELVFVFKAGRAPHINNVELGRHGRNRTNVWDYRGVNVFGGDRDEALEMHPTVKPVAMVADAILDCSMRGGIVLDAFVGSGTTLLAAERTGRRACAIELEPHYVDVAIRRFQNATGIDAVDADSGRTFAETEVDRQVEENTSDA